MVAFLWPRAEVFVPGRPAIAAVRHTLPDTVRPHAHDFLELALVLDGEAVQRSVCGEHRLAAGDLVVLEPGAWHAYERCRGLEVYDCCVSPELLAAAGPLLAGAPAVGRLGERAPRAADAAPVVCRVDAAAAGVLRDRLDGLRDALAGRRPLAALGSLLLVLDALGRALPDDRPSPPPVVAAAARLLAGDLAAPWTLAGLADRLRIDRSHLARRFRAAYGAAPMAWLALRRGERAAHLLATTAWPIARIAAAVGWPDAAHFAHRFHRAHGVSARAWRDARGDRAS